MKKEKVDELLLEALETEKGGVEIYTTALQCTFNEDLRKEWQKYLDQTTQHVEAVAELCEAFWVTPGTGTAGRKVVRHIGEALVQAMKMAKESAPDTAEIVAAECVTLAETKDHHNWGLIGALAKQMKGDEGKALKA